MNKQQAIQAMLEGKIVRGKTVCLYRYNFNTATFERSREPAFNAARAYHPYDVNDLASNVIFTIEKLADRVTKFIVVSCSNGDIHAQYNTYKEAENFCRTCHDIKSSLEIKKIYVEAQDDKN